MLTRNPWRGVGGLPASVWIVFATTFVNRAGTMVVPFMVLYVTRHLGRAAGPRRDALTVYGLGGLVSGPMAGRLCDRLGAFAVLRGALVLSASFCSRFPSRAALGTFLAITFVWSLVAESVRPATMAALTVGGSARAAQGGGRRQPARHQPRDERGAGGRRLLATVSFPLLFVVDGASALAAGVVLTALLAWRPLARLGRAASATTRAL